MFNFLHLLLFHFIGVIVWQETLHFMTFIEAHVAEPGATRKINKSHVSHLVF